MTIFPFTTATFRHVTILHPPPMTWQTPPPPFPVTCAVNPRAERLPTSRVKDLFAADFEPIPLPDAELAMLRNALHQDSRALAADTHSGDALAFRNDPDMGQARTTAAPDPLVRRSRRRACLFWNRTPPLAWTTTLLDIRRRICSIGIWTSTGAACGWRPN